MELERYGGTVEKFIGDAVMAVFGAPTAREDDPERAVRAALAVRDAMAEMNDADAARDLHVRIGITTGETLVRLDARPERGEGMAVGDVVNTAARLQSAAPTDSVLVDETTYRATERSIEHRVADPVVAKGKAEPIPAFEAVQARARYGVDVRQIGSTPLIGRERELAALRAGLDRARTTREPQLVTLVGVPGIGKSRLVYELFQGLEAEPDLITWRQGRSLPYGEGVSYWALAEMVKAQAGILETDTEAEVATKLREAVADAVRDEREAVWVERNLRPLVGLATDAELGGDRRAEAFSAWRRFFESMAESGPLVLVFEDLHFADDGLLDFVDYLVDWAADVPLLVVGTARPELLVRRPGHGGTGSNALTLSLSALSDTETARIVHALLGQAVLPADLQERLLARAEGNPLYAEEFARLVAEGRRPDELPETVQGIIAARIDGLAAEEKAVLQDASVVGKVFWLGAVAALGDAERWAIEERLRALERKEFIRRERRGSMAGETEYAFRHLLVRDVASGQIPRAERAGRHVRAAEWIEGLGRPEDHAEMLAHHYLSALELSRAAGQDVSGFGNRAHRALRDAGDRASGLYAFGPAARFYGEALATADGADPELSFCHAEALFRVGDEGARSALEEARTALAASGSNERAAEADALLADAWWHRVDRDRCFQHLERAEQAVRERPPSHAKSRVLSQVARYHALAGHPAAAIAAGTEALTIAEQLGLDEVRANALNSIGVAEHYAGDTSAAISDLEQSIEIALAINSPVAARSVNNLSAVMWAGAGNLGEALRLRRESIRLAEQFGLLSLLPVGESTLVVYLYSAGLWDEALELAERLIAEAEREPHVGESYARRMRALIRHARGNDAGVLDDASRALEVAHAAKDPGVLIPALSTWLRLSAEHGLAHEIERTVEELLEALSGKISSADALAIDAVLVAPGSPYAADLRRALEPFRDSPWSVGDRALLEDRYGDAAAALAEMGNVVDEAFVRLRAAEQHAAAGRRVEANAELERALAVYRSIGATRYIRQGEALLAASA